MPKKKRELPTPPNRPFGPKKRFEDTGDAGEAADRITMAAAQGKLDEVLKEEFGDNVKMRELAMMMLGASGMAPTATAPKKAAAGKTPEDEAQKAGSGKKTPETEDAVPLELLNAAQSGDIEGVSDLLSKEMNRRTAQAKEPSGPSPEELGEPGEPAQPDKQEPYIEKATLDTLMRIAAENDVSVDWVMARALKLYVRDYLGTGRI